MKLALITVFLLFCYSAVIAQESPFSSYQWKNRLLVIFVSGEEGEKLLEEQKVLIDISNEDFAIRKLKALLITENKVLMLSNDIDLKISSEEAKEFLSVKQGSHFQVSLIGLDGGIKLQQNIPITEEKLYNTIDAMPMRQREMRQNKE